MKGSKELVQDLIQVFDHDGNDQVSVGDFVSMTQDALDGRLPQPKLKISKEQQELYDNASIVEKVLLYGYMLLSISSN